MSALPFQGGVILRAVVPDAGFGTCYAMLTAMVILLWNSWDYLCEIKRTQTPIQGKDWKKYLFNCSSFGAVDITALKFFVSLHVTNIYTSD